MKLAVDLHSHSGYAGGVGQIELTAVSKTIKLKGIDVFGTGDCIFPPRTEELKRELTEVSKGLFALHKDKSKFLLQTEVIFSTKLVHKRNKTIAHHIILFPDFESIYKMQKLMNKWGMKNTIGRPFITSNTQKELEDQLFEISNIHPLIEIIPAHVMTPDGIFGSKNDLDELIEFYGKFLPKIKAIETGLSADPQMLEKIPDLAALTFISNSDCHSAALNRIGREFTILDVDQVDYKSIIHAIRQNNVIMTAEFNPAEGRYFLTGHRADRKGHSHELIFADKIPEQLICPICNKKMNLGVRERTIQLQDNSIIPISRNYLHLIPLIEVIAASQNLKSITSKRVQKIFDIVMNIFPSEIALWQSDSIQVMLDKRVDQKTINQILAVKKGDFKFQPPGFDGTYGKLIIGDN
ncbi:MAG: endonuclease Q family protein [Candidatus Cloacimonadota bacterium]|nr:endonuclease Q family protein [Candidatus Cloacimonadota bacterium]